jgi:hypothetical protein
MEPVFAAAFAVLLGGESLGPSALMGGALVVGAILTVQQPSSTQESHTLAYPRRAHREVPGGRLTSLRMRRARLRNC